MKNAPNPIFRRYMRLIYVSVPKVTSVVFCNSNNTITILLRHKTIKNARIIGTFSNYIGCCKNEGN